MKKNISFAVVGLMALIALMGSCRRDPDFNTALVSTGIDEHIAFEIPEGWPAPVYNFQNNMLTKEGFELGKRLFYETALSRDNSVSCGSCHQPSMAFAQIDHPVSHGVDDKLGTRNSPPLFNLNWHTSFFWDGGVNHIENQPINPIQNPVEMDETMTNVIAKLSGKAEYRAMFKAAFGDETINTQRISRAFAQFMGMLVSGNSKYDKYVRKEAGGELTQREQNGLRLFRENCATCHKEPLFSDFSFRNNGLAPNGYNDSGRAHITQQAEDMYKFKVPSLRNLKYSKPYMHDGRLGSLEAVLNHYTVKGAMFQSPTLDPILQEPIVLTEQEKRDIISFLGTLDDEQFVSDARFKDPVVR